MNILRQNLYALVLAVFEILVGVLLIIDPLRFTSGIIITAGIVLLIIGVFQIIRYVRMTAEEAAVSQTLARGLGFLLAGIFCTANSAWFVTSFPILTMLYGIAILLTGLGKIQTTVDLLRAKSPKWFLAGISAAVALICATLVLWNPFGEGKGIWIFAGILLIAEAVFDIVTVMVTALTKENAIVKT